MLLLRARLLLWIRSLTGLPARQCLPRLVANGDQERRHVLAMLPRLLKGRAAAARGDAFAAEADRNVVRLRVRTLHPPLCGRVVEVNLVHHLALLVVEPAQESASAQQSAQAAVGQRGKSICE